MDDPLFYPTVFMPNGKPAPLVLTEQELIVLLRLDVEGPKDPRITLQYYRDKGLLQGIRIGKRMRYTLGEVLKFLHSQSTWTNRKNVS